MDKYEPTEKQLKILEQLNERFGSFLNKDKVWNQLIKDLNATGVEAYAASMDMLIKVIGQCAHQKKRIYYVNTDGSVTFTAEDDKEFRDHFNITLNSPEDKK